MNPTLDFDPWFGTAQVAFLLVIVGLAAYGFHTALGGRSVIVDPLAAEGSG